MSSHQDQTASMRKTSRSSQSSDTAPTANAAVLQDLKTTLSKDAEILDYIPTNAMNMSSQPDIPGTLPYMLDLSTITDTSNSNRALTLVAFLTSTAHINVKDGGLPRVLFFGYGDDIITDRVPFTAKRIFQIAQLHDIWLRANCDPTMLTAVVKYVFLVKSVEIKAVGGFKSGFTRLLMQTCRAYKGERGTAKGAVGEKTSTPGVEGAKASAVEDKDHAADEPVDKVRSPQPEDGPTHKATVAPESSATISATLDGEEISALETFIPSGSPTLDPLGTYLSLQDPKYPTQSPTPSHQQRHIPSPEIAL